MMVLSMVLNMSKDPDPGVCSAAVRTLGVFVTYPSLSEVGSYLMLQCFYFMHLMFIMNCKAFCFKGKSQEL